MSKCISFIPSLAFTFSGSVDMILQRSCPVFYHEECVSRFDQSRSEVFNFVLFSSAISPKTPLGQKCLSLSHVTKSSISIPRLCRRPFGMCGSRCHSLFRVLLNSSCQTLFWGNGAYSTLTGILQWRWLCQVPQ